MKSLLLIALLFCFPFESGRGVSASFSCPGREDRPPCQEFWFADAVFIARAKEVVATPFTTSDGPRWQEYEKLTARLSVEEVFRGNVGAEITFEMGDCYYPFKQGEKYLVYAHKGPDGKLRQQIHQTRTRLLSEAKADLDYLRGLADAPEGGRIYGKVYNSIRKMRLSNIIAPDDNASGMAGITVVAESGEKRYETTTNGVGEFEFRELPEGDYRVRALVPSYLSGDDDGARLFNKGCAPIDLFVQATGEIGGRVFDPSDQPVPKVIVTVFSAEGATEELIEKLKPYSMTRHETDELGRFKFDRLPAGRYLVAINLVKQENTVSKYPRTFFPSVLNLSEAGIIILGDGEKKQNVNVKLLPPADPK